MEESRKKTGRGYEQVREEKEGRAQGCDGNGGRQVGR